MCSKWREPGNDLASKIRGLLNPSQKKGEIAVLNEIVCKSSEDSKSKGYVSHSKNVKLKGSITVL